MSSITRSNPDHAAAHLAAIVDSSFDAIISKDLDSVITTWNKAAVRLFGYSEDEAIGRSILMLIPENLRGEEAVIIARIRAGERVESYETVRLRKDGQLVNVSLTVSPIRDGSGKIVGASKIARDITAQKASERQIHLLLREVNHRVKNQFAVILSMIRETRRRTLSPEEFEGQIRERIIGLSKSHDLLVGSDWSGAKLWDLVQEHLQPFGHERQIVLSGPLVTLQPGAVQYLGMAFHELGTNSAKYGGLSTDSGHIRIAWDVVVAASGRRELKLTWDERFPPDDGAPRKPDRVGFGTVVLERVAPESVGGTAELVRAEGVLRWTLTAPLESIVVL